MKVSGINVNNYQNQANNLKNNKQNVAFGLFKSDVSKSIIESILKEAIETKKIPPELKAKTLENWLQFIQIYRKAFLSTESYSVHFRPEGDKIILEVTDKFKKITSIEECKANKDPFESMKPPMKPAIEMPRSFILDLFKKQPS